MWYHDWLGLKICLCFFLLANYFVLASDVPPTWLNIPPVSMPPVSIEQLPSATDSTINIATDSTINIATDSTISITSTTNNGLPSHLEITDFELPPEFLPSSLESSPFTVESSTDNCSEARESLKDFDSRLAAKEKARSLLKSKKYTDLLTIVSPLLCLEPENREMLYIYAHARKGLNEYQEAAVAYNNLVALYADFFDGWYERADVYRRLKNIAEALSSYEQAIKIRPNNSWVHYDRAVLLKNQKRWDDALEGFHEAIRLNPRHSWAYYEVGNIHFWRRQFVHALKYYQETKKLNPKAPSLNENIAICEKALSER